MKKIISVILATAMLAASLSVVGFAYETKTAVYPEVQVHGFSYQELYLDKDDTSSDVIWPPTSDTIFTAVKDSIPYLAKFAVTRDWDTLGTQLAPIVRKIFEPAFLDENGNPQGNTGIYFEYPTKEEVIENPEQLFEYDWRLDPIETAAQLNDFIDYILDCTGAKKVNLQCHSFGGVVATTYFSIYGCDKVKTVVFNSTAIYGETYTGELMTGRLTFGGDALQNYLFYAFQGNEYENLINAAIKAVHDTGLMDILTKGLNGLSSKVEKEVCSQSIVPLFGGWLAVWAMVPDEYLDDAIDFVFNTIYGESEMDYSALRAKIENYNNLVRCKKTETLKEVNEKCNVYVITRYGYSSLPMTPSASNLGDGIIDVKYASFGATASEYGKTLEDIMSDAKFISPDKTVDASTCLFPEQTWFVKNMKHGSDEDALNDMMKKFMRYDGQATVETFEEYPRFTIFDGESILPEMPIEKQPTIFDKIRLIVNDIIKLVKTIINKVK